MSQKPPIPPPPPKKRRGQTFAEWMVPTPESPVVLPGNTPIEGVLAEVYSRTIPQMTAEMAEAAMEYARAEDEPDPDGDLSMLEKEELTGYLAEIARRQQEAIRLFVPRASQREFLESKATYRLVRGGNRGGKTLIGAVMCAKCLMGIQPGAPKRDGKFIVVGKDLKHCGDVIYEKLFKPGAFKIVKDPVTREWRTYNPALPWDAANEAKAKPAPPLIPSRFIESIAWENKRDEIPKTVRLKNGWSLQFFSGEGAPRQGIVVDVAWFDEEIPHPSWFKETRFRIVDRKGFFYWTATPQAGTLELYSLHTSAMEQLGTENPSVMEIVLGFLENHYIGKKEKDDALAGLDEEEYAVRVEGDFALLGARIYPTFAPKGAHGIDGFPIPQDWTRYVAIDPGHQFCAVLFCAVPPPGNQYRGKVIVYDELYIKKCDAVLLAKKMREKIDGQVIYSFIIDHRAGRQTELTTGKTVEEQYSAAFKKERIECEKTGVKFSYGSDEVQAGILAVRSALRIADDGTSRFLFVKGALPNLCKEMAKYSYRRTPAGVVLDEPIKLNDHLADCLRYLAAAHLRYSKPRSIGKGSGYTTAILKRKADKKKAEKGNSIRLG